jgi:hypothetical protein
MYSRVHISCTLARAPSTIASACPGLLRRPQVHGRYITGTRSALPAPAPAENLICAGGSRCASGADVVRGSARRGAHVTRERCGMVVDRAAATGLPRCGERVRAAAPAPEECAQAPAPRGAPGYRAPLAPGHARAPERPLVLAPAPGPAAHRALDPRPGAAAGPRESRVGGPPGTRRTAAPGHAITSNAGSPGERRNLLYPEDRTAYRH